MIFADQLRDAARVAEKAAVLVTIEVKDFGFWVRGRAGGANHAIVVPFDELELRPINPLVEAVRTVVSRLR